jgi:hypothetical protein
MKGVEGALLLNAVASLVAAIGTIINGARSSARGAKTEQKLEALHLSTNGLSERNEAIARKLGVAEGKAQERQEKP